MAARATLKGMPPVLTTPGCSGSVGSLVKALGGSAAFLVTDEMLVKIGMAAGIAEACAKKGVPCTIYDGIVPNPTVSCIDAGVRMLQAMPAGAVVVTLGGGSVMDAGKCIAVVASQGAGASVSDFVGRPRLKAGTDQIDFATLMAPKQPSHAAAKIVAIPTTSGTGSETNGAAVVTDDVTHKKLYFISDSARASFIVLDPKLTVGMPLYPTASCGMDVLTHAMEAFTSNRTNPYSDALAYGAIELVSKYLPAVMSDPSDLNARSQMQYASFMAAAAFDSAQLGLMHALGHQLTSLYGQPHGQTLATMMPHVMAFNIDGGKAISKYARIAVAFGVHDALKSPEENARRAIDAIVRLSIEVGTAKSIEMLGGSEADVPELTSRAMLDVTTFTNARPAGRKDIESLFRLALSNRAMYPAKL